MLRILMESSMTTTYTIDRLETVQDVSADDVMEYLLTEGPKISAMFDNDLMWQNFRPVYVAQRTKFYICRRNGKVTGHMICHLFNSPLDPTVKILQQISFYAKPDSGRTAYYLFQKFIDIGKKEANHIITMLTSRTNIKSSTLENLGFREIETLYQMEIKNG